MGSSIGRIVSEDLRNQSPSERTAQLADYIDGLEAERKKIEAFKREVPSCMLLLEITIMAVKEELTQCEKSNAVPVLEEFMPLKKITDEKHEKIEISDLIRDKMNWMSSAQLWNSDNQQLNDKKTLKPDNIKSCKNRIAGTAFWPFNRCTNFPVLPVVKEDGDESTMVPGLCLGPVEDINSSAFSLKSRYNFSTDNHSKLMGGQQSPFNRCTNFPVLPVVKEDGDESTMVSGLSLGPVEDINSSAFSLKSRYNFSRDNHSKLTGGQQSQQLTRKQRRCWSPELHRRFVDALQQLGGVQAATPKQIRELMRVDGLSNDEVKSHLQKYRIHTRRVGASANTSHPTVLGASWMLSQEQCFESSKQRNFRPGSPQCHTHLAGFSRGTTLTGGDSMEDEDDEKSVSHSWRNEIQLSLGDNDDVKMGRFGYELR